MLFLCSQLCGSGGSGFRSNSINFYAYCPRRHDSSATAMGMNALTGTRGLALAAIIASLALEEHYCTAQGGKQPAIFLTYILVSPPPLQRIVKEFYWAAY